MFAQFARIGKEERDVVLMISHSHHARLRIVIHGLNMVVHQSVDQWQRLEHMGNQLAFGIIGIDAGIGGGDIESVVGQEQEGFHIGHNLSTLPPCLVACKVSIKMQIGINPQVALAGQFTKHLVVLEDFGCAGQENGADTVHGSQGQIGCFLCQHHTTLPGACHPNDVARRSRQGDVTCQLRAEIVHIEFSFLVKPHLAFLVYMSTEVVPHLDVHLLQIFLHIRYQFIGSGIVNHVFVGLRHEPESSGVVLLYLHDIVLQLGMTAVHMIGISHKLC